MKRTKSKGPTRPGVALFPLFTVTDGKVIIVGWSLGQPAKAAR